MACLANVMSQQVASTHAGFWQPSFVRSQEFANMPGYFLEKAEVSGASCAAWGKEVSPPLSPSTRASGSGSPSSSSNDSPPPALSLRSSPVSFESEPMRIHIGGAPGLERHSQFVVGHNVALRNELVTEVNAAVGEQLDRDVAGAVNAMWQKGKVAFEQMQQRQANSSRAFEQQVMVCNATQNTIQDENVLLRRAVEALVGQLQTQTPANQSSSGDTSTRAMAAAQSAPTNMFKITLRRAVDVPLGLVMSPDSSGRLVVVEILPGGAVASWNRQNVGEVREIRKGDIVVGVNGAESPEDIVTACLQANLLKLTMQHKVGANIFSV